MRPTRASYLYYEPGDFMGLHTDLPSCALTMLTSLGGDAPPLVVHPELPSLEPSRLEEIAHAGVLRPGGVPLPVSERGVSMLLGSETPHHRPVVDAEHDVVVVTLCYTALA